MKYNAILTIGILVFLVLLSGVVLSSTFVNADDIVDEINITVPVSCSMSGTGQNTHNAEIVNGIYTADIGITTLHAFCNDSEGFAIYATGYTGNTVGGADSNKLVGINTDESIITGTAVSAGNPDVSNWAMKLAITQDSGDITGTNALAIDNSFNNYHVVPNEYTKVAHKNSATDMTEDTGGIKLTTSYAVYISKTQVADTYSGQVIYTLVHPSTAPEPVGSNQIGVIYDGNGLYFDQAGTKTTNKVVYERTCESEYGYIADTPAIIKTTNLNDDGTQNGPYMEDYCDGNCVDPGNAEFEGASKVKLVIRYALSTNTIGWHGLDIDHGSVNDDLLGDLFNLDINRAGTITRVYDGSSVGLYLEGSGSGNYEQGYDYGIYIEVYPIYDEFVEGTTYEYVRDVCSYQPVVGAYAETAGWIEDENYWYNYEDDGYKNYFYYETVDGYDDDSYGITRFLKREEDSLLGSTLTVYAYNPYKIVYDGNNATAGTMNGFYTALESNTVDSVADLMAPNFRKAGYGFAGWSADRNDTVNSNNKIYGPNERISGDELTFDSNTRETTLYAVWVPTTGNMQSFSCSSLSSGQITALTDNRDNNVYTVGKMQDDNCWMMENLRLDNTATTLSSSNTNNPASGFMSLSTTSDDWCEFSSDACINQSKLNTNNTNIGGINTSSVSLVVSPGVWNGVFIDYKQEIKGNNDHVQWYGYGNYYNWFSATAGNGVYSTGADIVASGDICPNGWHLPYGGIGTGTKGGRTSGGFVYLDVRMSEQSDDEGGTARSNRWRSFPNNFVYSGYKFNDTVGGRGYSGKYWSSTVSSSSYASTLSLENNMIFIDVSVLSKYSGASVRCVTATSS